MMRVGMEPRKCAAELSGLLDAVQLQISPVGASARSSQDLPSSHNLAIGSEDLL